MLGEITKGFFYVLLLVFGFTTRSISQTSKCEVVYSNVEVQPTYDGGTAALMEYFEKNVMPIISKSENKELTTKMTIILTIDSEGRVTDAILSRHKLPKSSEEEIQSKLITMTGWKHGRLNGEQVCCRYGWIISCIKWS